MPKKIAKIAKKWPQLRKNGVNHQKIGKNCDAKITYIKFSPKIEILVKDRVALTAPFRTPDELYPDELAKNPGLMNVKILA